MPITKPYPKEKKKRKAVKPGKKTNRWNYVRQQLKSEFLAMGVTRCEICGTTENLSFAHRVKRRFIQDDAELRYVALLCIPDHEVLERGKASIMYDRITDIVRNRSVRILEETVF